MPRPRFDALPEPRRRAILDTAAVEFAAHGFDGASYNRIIERSGTSKGAMYYYFDDKADLYGTVLLDTLGPFLQLEEGLSPIDSAEAFWGQVRQLCASGLDFYDSDPNIAGLIRSLGTEPPNITAVRQLRAMSRAWFAALIDRGQRVGAVRTDLPTELMLGMATAVSEAVDLWLARQTDLGAPARAELVEQLVDLYRRMGHP